MSPFPQLIENRLDLWPIDLNIDRGHLLIKDYLPTKFEASGAKCSWLLGYQLHKVKLSGMTFDPDLWPTDLNTNRNYLIIMDYLPTKQRVHFKKKYTWAPKTVHNTPVMNILKGYFYLILF